MPRRKRIAYNPRKTQLVFLESPKPGQLHEYGPHPEKTDPVCVPTRPLDESTSVSWVSPQFDQNEPLHFPGRRCPQHTSINSTIHNKSRNTSCIRSRATACKFPTLSFTSKATSEKRQTRSVCSRKKSALPMCIESRVVVLPQSPIPQESSYNRTLSPPDLLTPDKSLQCIQSMQLSNKHRTPIINEKSDQRDRLNDSQVGDSVQVLAEDTPEHQYGMRVTWRRRERFMRYLKERGRLENSQILVKK
ncbi:RAD9, HUS1, RAD1-interacting nuclear orphan 1 [Pelobates cultripes]|uniref:RAD9, HUS1, RAD1-interacting nuclear orphan 1 n=1 Tax=Pelobates cultripes TaxID=61616 RepID=A0AAD1RTK5_PELCU|nr:RAD9, HUS1, RAD1-interacting nuclear orphan 1 [Pelobates cultripes]